ncbi:MAG: NUDIX hydrolase [Chlorobi bacterium]|nr:NUDIX hydrolase [Chlorobiota bacterium]
MTPADNHQPELRWKTLQRRDGGDFRLFRLEWVRRQHPRDGRYGEFIVLHTPAWVNVIPITPDNTVVMVRQYRHGSDCITLEFPGGVLSPDEDPARAAMRECTEETGYAGVALESIGEQFPNPAFLATRCYTYAWYGCQYVKQPQWDAHEVVETVEIPFDRVEQLIANGEIQHSIMIAAWTLFRLRTESVEHSCGGLNG